MEANGSVDLAWNAARLALALLCAFIAGALVLRWAAKQVPLHGSKRRFVQSLTVAGGVAGLIPGMLLGMIGGADIGGAFMAIPFQFWLGLPNQLAWFIGLVLFMVCMTTLLALLGSVAGTCVGYGLWRGVQFAQNRLGRS